MSNNQQEIGGQELYVKSASRGSSVSDCRAANEIAKMYFEGIAGLRDVLPRICNSNSADLTSVESRIYVRPK